MLGMTSQYSLSQCALHVSASTLSIPNHLPLSFANRNDWFTHAPWMHRCCSESTMASFFMIMWRIKLCFPHLLSCELMKAHRRFHLGAIPGTGKSSDINWNSSYIVFWLCKIFHCTISETILYALLKILSGMAFGDIYNHRKGTHTTLTYKK